MKQHAVGVRLAGSAVVGVVLAVGLSFVVKPWLAGVIGWIGLATTFCVATWLVVHRLDAAGTRRHATREDPTYAVGRVVLVVASLASLGGVGVLLHASSKGAPGSIPWEALIGVASVAASWVLVHQVYMLHYARLYYTGAADAGIDFNGEGDPDYHDFAYLSYTLGMTYQVSDTSLTGRDVRRAALRHALLSYLLGALVIAVTINLVVQLASSG